MKKLLIIENDADTLFILGYIFSGYTVINSTKIISIDEIRHINPNLIIIDYLLDNGYGDDLCAAIKADPSVSKIPVILYSAYNNIEHLAKQSHADAFIAKPFEIPEFNHLVNELAL